MVRDAFLIAPWVTLPHFSKHRNWERFSCRRYSSCWVICRRILLQALSSPPKKRRPSKGNHHHEQHSTSTRFFKDHSCGCGGVIGCWLGRRIVDGTRCSAHATPQNRLHLHHLGHFSASYFGHHAGSSAEGHRQSGF